VNRERRALILTGTGCLDRAAMELDEMFDDRQSEPKTAKGLRCRQIALLETIEYMREDPTLSAQPVASTRSLSLNRARKGRR
jgi:hypothetical protein